MSLKDEDLKDVKEDVQSEVFCLSQKKMVDLDECQKMKDSNKCSGQECFSWLNGKDINSKQ